MDWGSPNLLPLLRASSIMQFLHADVNPAAV